jgi:hypothetical protein
MTTWADIADAVREQEAILRAMPKPITPTASPEVSAHAVSSAAPADPAGSLPSLSGSVGALSFDATENAE